MKCKRCIFKKIITLFLCISLITFVGCNNTNSSEISSYMYDDISEQRITASKEAISIIDSYLNYDMLSQDAVTQLDEIINRYGENLTDNELLLKLRIENTKYAIENKTVDERIIRDRNNIAEMCDVKLLKETEDTLDTLVKFDDFQIKVSSVWKKDENYYSYTTFDDIIIKVSNISNKNTDSAENAIKTIISKLEDEEDSYFYYSDTSLNNGNYACKFTYNLHNTNSPIYYEEGLMFIVNDSPYMISVSCENGDTDKIDEIFNKVKSTLLLYN